MHTAKFFTFGDTTLPLLADPSCRASFSFAPAPQPTLDTVEKRARARQQAILDAQLVQHRAQLAARVRAARQHIAASIHNERRAQGVAHAPDELDAPPCADASDPAPGYATPPPIVVPEPDTEADLPSAPISFDDTPFSAHNLSPGKPNPLFGLETSPRAAPRPSASPKRCRRRRRRPYASPRSKRARAGHRRARAAARAAARDCDDDDDGDDHTLTLMPRPAKIARRPQVTTRTTITTHTTSTVHKTSKTIHNIIQAAQERTHSTSIALGQLGTAPPSPPETTPLLPPAWDAAALLADDALSDEYDLLATDDFLTAPTRLKYLIQASHCDILRTLLPPPPVVDPTHIDAHLF